MLAHCPFCDLSGLDVDTEWPGAILVRDAFPSAPGHRLVIPRRHVLSIFELPADEQAAIWELVREARQRAMAETGCRDFTIGVNDGPAAGQTVAHAHVHVIPRSGGDVPDPRGGIRWVLPRTANYWDR